MIVADRMMGTLQGDFVVFLIGMRINKPLKFYKWLPVAGAMSRMLEELYSKPELGFLHHESWISRTTIQVQYWRSMDQLLSYAKNRDAEHLPAWHAFNKAVGFDGTVGIWHETFAVTAGNYECVYGNMPPFGLGRAGELDEARGHRKTASGRLGIKL
ncbi:DUF4188 domain-containing protein [Novosphingobium sp.]|uniref:DUF4188 domain-containing protein n=1 Tax=Novosphingobium sp. TaxID=1874826 RepID=UPI0025D8058D|nr:DUF4188 domain-containing protein [Novosphingobium sp.]